MWIITLLYVYRVHESIGRLRHVRIIVREIIAMYLCYQHSDFFVIVRTNFIIHENNHESSAFAIIAHFCAVSTTHIRPYFIRLRYWLSFIVSTRSRRPRVWRRGPSTGGPVKCQTIIKASWTRVVYSTFFSILVLAYPVAVVDLSVLFALNDRLIVSPRHVSSVVNHRSTDVWENIIECRLNKRRSQIARNPIEELRRNNG